MLFVFSAKILFVLRKSWWRRQRNDTSKETQQCGHGLVCPGTQVSGLLDLCVSFHRSAGQLDLFSSTVGHSYVLWSYFLWLKRKKKERQYFSMKLEINNQKLQYLTLTRRSYGVNEKVFSIQLYLLFARLFQKAILSQDWEGWTGTNGKGLRMEFLVTVLRR